MESLARQTLGVHVSCKLPHLVVCPLSTGLVGFDVFQQRFHGSWDDSGVFFGPLHGVCLDIGRRLARCELTRTVCVYIQIEDSQGAFHQRDKERDADKDGDVDSANVHTLPDPVGPYAKMVEFWPSTALTTNVASCKGSVGVHERRGEVSCIFSQSLVEFWRGVTAGAHTHPRGGAAHVPQRRRFGLLGCGTKHTVNLIAGELIGVLRVPAAEERGRW